MLKIVEDEIFAAAAALDRETEKFERRMRYEEERDRKNGVTCIEHIEELHGVEDTAQSAIDRAMYWDVLRGLPREDALVLVLRYCMGYSATEISAGLGLSYAQVKYRCRRR